MLLWLSFAILTASVVTLLLQPLRKPPATPVDAAEADLAVYRDQLRELDHERERGLIGASEIESARAEVARRLLKRAGTDGLAASATTTPHTDALSARRARNVVVAVAALIPLASVALYLMTGAPGLPGQPFAERQAAPGTPAQIVELIGRVETHLRAHPEDGKGWDVVAPVYLRLGRYADAAHAFAEATRLEGETVRRLMGFAEATMMVENGIVSEPVRKVSERILALEPGRVEARIWLTLAKEQDGDLAGAAAAYRELLSGAPADAPWRQAVADRLDLVTKKLNGEPVPDERPVAAAPEAPPAAGPASGAPDLSQMSPADRERFITSMVDRLAARLKSDGKDLAGWIRLARAYKVLGRESDARAAIASARENFSGDKASLDEIAKSEQSLGITSGEATPQ